MADVSSALDSWSTTAGNNSPSGSTTIGTGLDDNLRQIQAVVRSLASSNSITAAATTDLSTVSDTFITVNGTTTITALGTLTAGMHKWLTFAGALTLTHNGTSLILPGGASITTAAGDTALVVSLGSGNWRCLTYVPAAMPFKVGSLTRDLTTASGDVAYTGIGFKPRAVAFICGISGTRALSLGFDDATNHYCFANTNATADSSYTSSLAASILPILQSDATAYQTGIVKSFDADGFTLTWTKTGAATGTAAAIYLAFR